jgi:hypothetical protein
MHWIDLILCRRKVLTRGVTRCMDLEQGRKRCERCIFLQLSGRDAQHYGRDILNSKSGYC